MCSLCTLPEIWIIKCGGHLKESLSTISANFNNLFPTHRLVEFQIFVITADVYAVYRAWWVPQS